MDKIIEELKSIDGIGKKVAEKILFDLIINKNKISSLETVINEIKKSYSECNTCFYFKENNVCTFCNNKNRNQNIICVVSTKLDAIKIAKSNYNGLIHVLNGEINLNKNIGPEKIKISELFVRISKGIELLLALNLTFEGEVTSNYIANKAKGICEKISRIARGIPLGGVLDYIDQETLNDAILNRKKLDD
ncbi:toprim domain-containing protein [Spiroplasma cantharicola]|uniref:Recombination protein RecR n=1 Tax=Spiroplasma cantharicola TaxID=362837 RepID=A0A0M3SJ08_9MOLU|nr:toprim domain-containing protein [Spiroplasma cantharicola]ALD65918.1 recombination protein RecR [Spiroplasma cantharicola]